MPTNIQQYRRKKKLKIETAKIVKVPVYNRVYLEENSLIGEFSTGVKEVIKEYETEE